MILPARPRFSQHGRGASTWIRQLTGAYNMHPIDGLEHCGHVMIHLADEGRYGPLLSLTFYHMKCSQ
jgi:hypothetical protein